MMMDTQEQPQLNPQMLVLAREAKSLTQSQLADLIGVTQSKISKLEAGLLQPTSHDLRALAQVLDRPENFFSWPDQVYGFGSHELFHRKRQKAKVKALNTVHAEMNIRRMQLSRLLRAAEVEVEGITPIDPDEYDGDIERIARLIRGSWLVPPGPIQDVVQLVESRGVIVIPHDFGTRHIDAVSQWVPGLPPIIFINAALQPDRLRYTICHELGHLLLHRTIEADAEREADRFASEFLMPATDILHDLYDLTVAKLASLKQYWKVSMAALLKRASDLGTITSRHARTLWMRMGSLGYRKQEPVDLSNETPAVFKSLIQFHREHLDYSPSELRILMGENNVPRLAGDAGAHLSVVA